MLASVMKMALTICLLLITGILFSQGQSFNPAAKNTDKAISTRDLTDPAQLSQLLTAPYHTEREKVLSIFTWIAENISYYRNTPKYAPRRKNNSSLMDDDDPIDTGALKPLTERIAIQVLRQRRTYCDGYARLFKSLCDHADIRSEIVTGYARSDMNRAEEKFSSNHSWNAVYIDSAWYLLDVTWASGYSASSSGEFVRHYDDYYFLTPPDQFIRHHYPDDLRWTLLKNPPPLYEFRYTPFKQRSFIKYDITDYYPSRGIIDARVGDTLHLEIEMGNARWARSVISDSLWDSAALVHTPVYSFVQPDGPVRNNKVTYTVPVNSDALEWIHLMYNNDAVLRYRVNVKKTN